MDWLLAEAASASIEQDSGMDALLEGCAACLWSAQVSEAIEGSPLSRVWSLVDEWVEECTCRQLQEAYYLYLLELTEEPEQEGMDLSHEQCCQGGELDSSSSWSSD